MRSLVRGVLVVSVVSVVFGASTSYAAPRRNPGDDNPIVKIVKRIIKTFGDGLTVPTGKP